MKKTAFIIVLAMILSLIAFPSSAEKLVFQGEGENIPDTFDVKKASAEIKVDGVIDDAYGDAVWTVVGASRYTDPEAFAIHPPADYDQSVLDLGSSIDSNFYFTWDEHYFYICAQTTKDFVTAAESKQDPWKAGTDCIQISILPSDTSLGEAGFSVVAPEDMSETWVWFFNNISGVDGTNAEESTMSAITCVDGVTTWEIAVEWIGGLGTTPKEGDAYTIAIAFFFGTDIIGSMGYQVGRYVFNNGRDITYNPIMTLSAASTAETVTVEEPETETVDDASETTTEAVAPVSTNPTTSDISVIFYVLTALSAAGFVAFGKRK